TTPPRSVRPKARGARGDLHDPDHVLTLWFTDPEYVDSSGKPRPLPAVGSTASIKSLVRRVSSKLSVEDALDHLIRNRAIRRVGRRYIPTGEVLRYDRGSSFAGTVGAHHLLVLNELVRNFEFNAKLKPGDSSWPQLVVECPDFPAEELGAFI